MGRTTHALAILGPELHAKLPNTRVLLVGSGGIGCELLKNLVLTGFGHITLLDLDTIDISNLNRQFLFRKKDVKKSKALVAARTASSFNPFVKITPLHANIKDGNFDISWFKGFDLVLNALDNLEARRHVNKLCMAANVPLVESGTAGYLGQVQPLLKDKTECFDCLPKPTPKTFPVCTIRSTPSQPIHCIVWAKSYLFPTLFGDEEDESELDDAENQGENPKEIATLRQEAQAFKTVRASLRFSQESTVAKSVFDKVFNSDVKNLLRMADMWRSRQPPIPLEFDQIVNGQFDGSAPSTSKAMPISNGSGTSGKLKDQRSLSLLDNLELFVSSTNRLSKRLKAGECTISFDKDDDDTLDFVTAASNLRSFAYGIDRKSRWEVKEMAGNIIPAIATTNAIVAGLIVLQALHLLRKSYKSLKNVHLQFKPSAPLGVYGICTPSPTCGVCRDTYCEVLCDPATVTLGYLVRGVLGDDDREVSVYEDKRLLSDPDFDDNLEKTLESLGVSRGKFLTIVDEDGMTGTLAIGIGPLPEDCQESLLLPDPLPNPPRKVKATTPPRGTSLKRRASSEALAPAAKRSRTAEYNSPSKAQRLERDGLVIVEDDVIVIDD